MRKKSVIAVAIVSFSMAIAVGSTAMQLRVRVIEQELMTTFSLTDDAFTKALEAQLAEIAEMDFPEFIRITGFSVRDGRTTQPPDEKYRVAVAYLMRTTPLVLARMLFGMLIMFIAVTYFLLLFTRGRESGFDAARRLPVFFVRMSGLAIWMLVRSFLWIPFVGPFIAIYMLPRLSLAPVYLASGEARIRESVRLSMKRSAGLWLPLFVRLLFISVSSLLMLWLLLFIIVGVALFSMKIGYILLLLVLFGVIAYQCAALTVLAVMMA